MEASGSKVRKRRGRVPGVGGCKGGVGRGGYESVSGGPGPELVGFQGEEKLEVSVSGPWQAQLLGRDCL